MKIRATELLDQLSEDVRQLLLEVNQLQSRHADILGSQPATNRWSVIQVLEHLNSYGRYYLPQLEKSLKGTNAPATEWYRSGWIGNYFTKLMKPGANGAIKNKMSAPKGHSPSARLDNTLVIDTFIDQQHWLLKLLEEARQKPIGRIRTPISISKFIRLKSGDTFRFLIAHEQRHFVQVANTIAELKAIKDKFPGDHQAA